MEDPLRSPYHTLRQAVWPVHNFMGSLPAFPGVKDPIFLGETHVSGFHCLRELGALLTPGITAKIFVLGPMHGGGGAGWGQGTGEEHVDTVRASRCWSYFRRTADRISTEQRVGGWPQSSTKSLKPLLWAPRAVLSMQKR